MKTKGLIRSQYFGLTILLVIAEIILAIMVLVARGGLSDNLHSYWVYLYNNRPQDLSFIQTTLHCCGFSYPGDEQPPGA